MYAARATPPTYPIIAAEALRAEGPFPAPILSPRKMVLPDMNETKMPSSAR
jgi:hypothetical protein